MSDQATAAAPQPDYSDLIKGKTSAQIIEMFIEYRDRKKKADDLYAMWQKANFDGPMAAMQGALMETLNTLGVDSISFDNGTAYKSMSTSVTVSDQREFRRHVLGIEDWDLIEWRVSKTRVNELVEKGEALPPGVNRSSFLTVNVRRK